MRPVLRAGELVNGGPVTVASDMSVLAAARLMVQQGVGALVVLDACGQVGVLSERDVMRELADGIDLGSTPVARVMTTAAVTVKASTPIEAAARTMSEEIVRHLIVADGGSMLGVVSARDIIDWYVASEPYREVSCP